ncbi:hypothetical protein V7114_18300 [Neobacillus niacini]
MNENMDVKEMKMVTSFITDEVEILVEIEGERFSIHDYDLNWKIID